MAKTSSALMMLLSAFWLNGCSQQSGDAYLDSAKVALLGTPDIDLSADKIASVPYASAYLTVGDLPRAFVVLAYAEQQQLKWVSADRNLFVMQQGRWVKTIGLAVNLAHIQSEQPDPLADGLHIDGASWHWHAVWDKDYTSGRDLISRFKVLGPEQIDVGPTKRSLLAVEEAVSEAQGRFSYRNRYWLDPKTGTVIQSRQQLGPDLPPLLFTQLKPHSPKES
ncbi:YjbF family lipoprotein [Pseudaeromonas paramecii]|uniref:YjbF family lipoprotein n=1 Tax=Pseudaeromonas paramecii TaxID=2138166 RepID=A0ABP8Q562_9GAMM